MKAAVLEHYGDTCQFMLKEMPLPEIQDGEILIRNKASSVNPIDTLVRQGKTRLLTGLGGDHVIGADFSGMVVESKSPNYQQRDEVFGFLSAVEGGAYAEFIVVKEENISHKPDNLSFAEAASLPLAASTAWQAMVNKGKIAERDKVLILGCTGGVGHAAVQIARSFDAKVTGTCSEEHMPFAYDLGCEVVLDYEKEKVPSFEKFDLIFDASGNFTLSDYKSNLHEDGVFVSTRGGANSLKGVVEAAVDLVFEKQMNLIVVKPNGSTLTALRYLAETQELVPHIHETFSLENISGAHEMVEKRGFTGKVVVSIA